MEETLIGLLAVAGTVIVGLLAAVITLFRRNGASEHNPNFGTLELLAKQQLKAAEESNGRLEKMNLTLVGIQTAIDGMHSTVGNCATVQRARERGEGWVRP